MGLLILCEDQQKKQGYNNKHKTSGKKSTIGKDKIITPKNSGDEYSSLSKKNIKPDNTFKEAFEKNQQIPKPTIYAKPESSIFTYKSSIQNSGVNEKEFIINGSLNPNIPNNHSSIKQDEGRGNDETNSLFSQPISNMDNEVNGEQSFLSSTNNQSIHENESKLNYSQISHQRNGELMHVPENDKPVPDLNDMSTEYVIMEDSE